MAAPGSSRPAGKKLRIAICHPDLGLGGAERLIVDAAAELAARGHEVRVFTAHHDPARCFQETVDGSFPVNVYGDFLPRHVLYRLHAVCAYVRCMFVALCMLLCWPAFDVVIADQVSAVIPILRLRPRTKILFYCHFPDMLLAERASGLRRAYRAPIDWLEETTTGTRALPGPLCLRLLPGNGSLGTALGPGASLARRHVEPSVLYPAVQIRHVEPPGAATSATLHSLLGGKSGGDIGPSAALEGLGGDARGLFLSINRFERKKNIQLAILAFVATLRRLEHGSSSGALEKKDAGACSSDGVKLVIAGGYDPRLRENREYLEDLRALAEREGVEERVVFVTSFSDEQKGALLAACLCVLYTPENEHFGIVPLEAMAAQKPVIACNSGGPKESVQHGATGFLCESTPQSFAVAMEALVREPGRAEAMGRAARRHVESNFSRTTFGDRLTDILHELVK
eukprot:jgi/Mesen1/5469/ME000273S04704